MHPVLEHILVLPTAIFTIPVDSLVSSANASFHSDVSFLLPDVEPLILPKTK